MDSGLKAAIEWEVLLRSGDASEQDRARFHEWCASDTAHLSSWQELQARLQPLRTLSDHHPQASKAALLAPSPTRRRLLKAGAGALTLMLGGVVTRSVFHGAGFDADWRSGIGQREAIDLADGMRMTLDADTAVYRTDDSASGNVLLRLARGQILIDLTKAVRGVSIATTYGEIDAVGGRCSIGMYSDHCELAVDGAPVALNLSGGESLTVIAGKDVSFGRGGVRQLSNSVESAFAWTKGLLVVSDGTVGDVVASLNRYFHGVLYADNSVAHRQVGGVFRLTDPLGSVRQLAASLGLGVTTYSDYIVVLSA